MVRKLLRGKTVHPAVRKRLLFGEVVQYQLKSSVQALKSHKVKQVYGTLLGKSCLKKYGILKKCKDLIPRRLQKWCSKRDKQSLQYLREQSARAKATIKTVTDFLSDDANSIMSPGKKEFCYKGEVQKIRYLTDSMVSLHEKFLANSAVKISYSQFAKLRPPYIVPPKCSARDTCACSRCENFKLIVLGAKKADLISESSGRLLVNSVCCPSKTDLCVSRKCDNCRDKCILYNEHGCDDVISYQQWKNVNVPAKEGKKRSVEAVTEGTSSCQGNEMKTMHVTQKVTEEKPISEFIDMLETALKDYMAHVSRNSHQYKTLKDLKANLSENDLVIHVDFSEKYSCKYATETQGVHFGGSRPLITLHTGVAYAANFKESFCTISECERQDPASIMAHLVPILQRYLDKFPLVTKVHFISDGPTTQYKCKDYFYLLTNYLTQVFPRLLFITHNFSEPGHGKGGPDGVGGALKNIADAAVAHGIDVNDFNSFSAVMKNVKNVFIHEVPKSSITEVDKEIQKGLQRFVGTMQVRQLTWCKEDRETVYFNSLSCFECIPGSICIHFSIGKPWKITVKLPKDTVAPKRPAKQSVQVVQKSEPKKARRSSRLAVKP